MTDRGVHIACLESLTFLAEAQWPAYHNRQRSAGREEKFEKKVNRRVDGYSRLKV